MFPTTLLTLLTTLLPLATPAALKPFPPSPPSPLANYTLIPLTWEARPYPWAPPVLIQGTIEDVVLSMLALNPQYLDNLTHHVPPPPDDEKTKTLASLDYRSHYCFGDLPLCSQTHTYMGAVYLSRLDGQPKAGPGPGECARVSCEWNSGITWCNDNDREVTLDSWRMIADAAWFIADHCTQGSERNPKTSGQIFYTTGWSTMVHGGMRC
ncbi:hypothetical protein B0T18DRAFT_484518 [Schizothecium vesticola]|uniref:Uncharacterized protein n=1 Tax=Schizothecium vesticola TaxID=314040 RepID=A0AA40KCH4_9PEZI|nr:hypothetical protein B0T18DRAFT_484518 [Schizothecium vesticola]